MKAAKRLATVLKIIGWVLIALAVGVTIYSLATSGGPWNTMKNWLSKGGIQQNIVDRVSFDHQYYSALIDAADTRKLQDSLRQDRARTFFTAWESKLWTGEEAIVRDNTEAFYKEYADGITKEQAEGFLAFFDQLESGRETRLLKETFEYLDGVAKPAAGKGKLAKLQAASVEPDVRAAYDKYAEAWGEGAGTYLEFVETVAAMVREDIAAGNNVTDAKGYVKDLDKARYDSALSSVQAQEREEAEDIREKYADELRKTASGEKADVRGYYETLYTAILEKYPGEKPFKDVFVNITYEMINDPTFDGSINTLMKEVRAADAKAQENSTDGAMTVFAKTMVVAVSDQNNDLGIFRVLWFLCANIIWLWVIGILLIILSGVIDRIVSKITLARLENAGIEEDPDILLRVEHLKQYFRSGSYINKAVDDVSFYIKKGEVFGLVGESGCGKTTTGRTIINLYDPTEGNVYFEGLRISSNQNGLPVLIRSLRNDLNMQKKRMQAELREKIASEPARKNELTAEYEQKLGEMKKELAQKIRDAKTNALESSVEKSKCVEKYREKRKAELTARYNEDMKTLTGAAAEARRARYEMDMKVAAKDNIMTKMQMIFQDPIASINPRMTVREIIAEGLKIRGIKDEKYIDEKVYEVLDLVGLVREHAARYPHEFSGGQRQRIGIARAIVLQPDLIIADEPISALDVSIQAQVINLLNDLRSRMGLTIMFIAHNLSVVKYFSDRIGVMYYGHLVELAASDELFEHPLHPYTRSLLSAIPYPDPHHEKHRKRIEYDPHKAHDYSKDPPTLREIRPGHFIRCNDAEFEAYRKELGE